MTEPEADAAAEVSVVVVGDGRAGGSFAIALADVGVPVVGPLGRRDDLDGTVRRLLDDPSGGDILVLLCVRDGEVAGLAAEMARHFDEWPPRLVVAHVAGSLPLTAVEPCGRRASLHPLVALPDATRGAALLPGATFALAGDDAELELVAALTSRLGGTAFEVGDDERVAYHAAAAIASNHLVALLDQAGRVAEQAGVPLDAYLPLVRATLDNVAAVGPTRALTGPAARGDIETLERHLAALDPEDRVSYRAMANLAARMAGTREL